MILFWFLCAALLLVAILFVALPLWRKSSANTDVQRDAANLGILRDQASELETDLQNGLLTQEAYEQGKSELQSRLIEEVKVNELSAAKPQRNPARVLAVVLAVMLPIFSLLIYSAVGNTDALYPQDTIVADANGVVRSDADLERLEKKVDAGTQLHRTEALFRRIRRLCASGRHGAR